jgi:hypothetical protein
MIVAFAIHSCGKVGIITQTGKAHLHHKILSSELELPIQ